MLKDAPGPGTIKPEWVRTMARDPNVFACANPIPKAVEQGLARKPLTYDQEYQLASAIIKNARDLTHTMMDEGYIEMTD